MDDDEEKDRTWESFDGLSRRRRWPLMDRSLDEWSSWGTCGHQDAILLQFYVGRWPSPRRRHCTTVLTAMLIPKTPSWCSSAVPTDDSLTAN
ncbi:unnamed protein product [Nippostrongylus brasiliensis]|uniref:Uncharacterized protein n=1 Tax=Nippostrongylus brasiliensis TaxID=27835 RepID=A0A0N4YV54_NIPBR|nr:unnamed protein product [Nippostrongylus brasiliensis]